MSGDMYDNPDALAIPDTQDSQTLDNKIPDSTEDARVLACWGRVNQRMRKDIGDAAWRHWIKPLRISRLKDGTLTLEADSTLARERVSSQYADRLRVISSAEFGDVSPTIRHVEVRLAENRQLARTNQPHRLSEQRNGTQKGAAPVSPTAGDDLLAGLDPRFTFANFVVGKPNELAFAVARRTAESEKVAFNPLFLTFLNEDKDSLFTIPFLVVKNK